jgi:hypothetical protein
LRRGTGLAGIRLYLLGDKSATIARIDDLTPEAACRLM